MSQEEFNRWFDAIFNAGDGGAPSPRQCSAEQLVTTPGEITDGSGPRNYENQLDCKWLITSPPGKHKIILTIKKFALERGYDNLYIFSIPEDTTQPLYTLTGRVEPGSTFESDTGKMLVQFTTDGSETDEGFVAQIDFEATSVDPEDVDDPGTDDGVDARITSVEFDMRAVHRAHKTDRYRSREEMIILRRGNSAQAVVTTSKAVECDQLHFVMYLFDSAGNMLSNALDVHDLGFDVKCDAGKKKMHQPTLVIPSNAAIGSYRLSVKLNEQEFKFPTTLAVIFNPWCQTCEEFWSSDPNLLNEYVLSENIGLWRGKAGSNRASRWSLDHFGRDVFYGALDMLQGLSLEQRRSAVSIVRQLSYMEGTRVLTGRWASSESAYEPYTKPWEWTGSQRIMAQWREGGDMGSRPTVKYAQCWVFSGVFTAVMRSLGLPSRSVTNFDSAHEAKPFEFNVDTYYVKAADGSDDYVRDYGRGRDKMWNFHVWNDVWIGKRTDCEGCDGWQATDATPQELSDGRSQLGPVPLKRIHDLNFSYDNRAVGYDITQDTKFLISESNSDRRGFLVDNGRAKHHFTDTNAVGKEISCNQPLRPLSRNDVTGAYKEREHGRLNRVWVNALSFLNEELPVNDVRIEEDHPVSVPLGSSYSMKYTFKLKDTVKEDRRVELFITGRMIDYTGEAVAGDQGTSVFKTVRQFVHLKPGTEATHTLKVDVDTSEYAPWAGITDWMEFSLSAKVIETEQRFLTTNQVQLLPARVDVVLDHTGAVKMGQMVNGVAVVKNPFYFPLSDLEGQLHMSGQDLDLDLEIEEIAPFGQIIVPFAVAPNVAGSQSLIVRFTAKEVTELGGSTEIDAQGDPGESRDAVATQAGSDAEREKIEKEEAQNLADAEKMEENATELEQAPEGAA
eukprot:TRINITY_DN63_c0_g1_i3.p1 TRINITY_DN63_c0_g1~~TRINITY_DN63_c0_g1_i3.p1  ORF type:complete len:1000 (+),score=241.63 TRINITY_DN63_c0_g1_i3:301-3000(+)